MATRFWVGGTGTWDGSATTHWSTLSGGASGASAPTSADDVVIDANSGSGGITIASGAACNNLTVTWTAVKTNQFVLTADFAPAGAVSINANSAINRLLIASSTPIVARTITIATLSSLSNVNFRDINGAGAAAPFTGTSIGDGQGCTGITFTTPAAQSYIGGDVSFSWSDATKWTSRVPLPQDDVTVSQAFTGAKTITIDMPSIGKSIDFTGITGNPTVSHAILFEFYGSFKHSASMTNSGAGGITAMGRGSFTLRSNGTAWLAPLTIGSVGTYTLEDAYVTSGASATLTNSRGTFADAGFSVSVAGYSQNNGGTATLNKTGRWDVSGTASAWSVSVGTVNDTAGRIRLTDASASTKVFGGGGKTYSEVYCSGAGAGAYQFTGSNTFTNFRADTGRNLQFTAGTTTTATNWFVDGCTIGSITAASHTLAKAGGGQVVAQTVSVSRSTATPGTTFYAMNGSTNGGNNSGWIFGAAVLPASAGAFALVGQAASLLATRRISAVAGAFSMVGSAANLAAFQLTADPRYVIKIDRRLFAEVTSRSFEVAASRRFTATKELHA